MRKYFSAYIILIIPSLLTNCMHKSTQVQTTQLEILEGKVIEKTWHKSFESWNAGGSKYFVLDVGSTPVKKKSAREGVILLPPDGKRINFFKEFKNKTVQVEGFYYNGQVYKPGPYEQYPLPGPGQKLMRGSGFKVINMRTSN